MRGYPPVIPEHFRSQPHVPEKPVFTMRAAYERARASISKSRIKEDSFMRQGASNAEIITDLSIVRDRKVREEKQPVFEGIVLEAIVADGVNNYEWFGSNAKFSHTSEYDDRFAGVDAVVEFQDSPTDVSTLGLAIDITEKAEKISEKLGDIQHGIETGDLAHLKYYRKQGGSLKGETGLSNIPKFLVVSDTIPTQRLAEKWYENDAGIANDPLQMDMLLQIRLQAQVYAAHAEKANRKNLADIFRGIDRRVQDILEQKQKQPALKSLASAKNFSSLPNTQLLLRKMMEMGFDFKNVKL